MKSIGKQRILLVDDDLDITTVLKKDLELNGFEVNAYNDPLKAIADYKMNYYDFHVLDIRMPGVTGYELARHIWSQDPNVEICFLSAYETYQEAKTVFQDANALCFLAKPISREQHSENCGSIRPPGEIFGSDKEMTELKLRIELPAVLFSITLSGAYGYLIEVSKNPEAFDGTSQGLASSSSNNIETDLQLANNSVIQSGEAFDIAN